MFTSVTAEPHSRHYTLPFLNILFSLKLIFCLVFHIFIISSLHSNPIVFSIFLTIYLVTLIFLKMSPWILWPDPMETGGLLARCTAISFEPFFTIAPGFFPPVSHLYFPKSHVFLFLGLLPLFSKVVHWKSIVFEILHAWKHLSSTFTLTW